MNRYYFHRRMAMGQSLPVVQKSLSSMPYGLEVASQVTPDRVEGIEWARAKVARATMAAEGLSKNYEVVSVLWGKEKADRLMEEALAFMEKSEEELKDAES